MEIFEFDINKCIECKKILNKNAKSRQIYKNNCSYSKFIGNCVNLYLKLKPNDYKDFYDKVLMYAEEHHDLPIKERGLTYEEFYMLAHKYKVLLEDCTNVNYDISVYFYSLICHAIVETFLGQKKEEMIMKYISDKGFEVKKIEGKKDARCGVDIEVIGKGKHFYIQVKPTSFFTSNFNDTEEDRISACVKREKMLKLENMDTLFIIYDFDWETFDLKWVLNKDDKLLFSIEDLFQYDKNDIKNTFKRLKLSDKYVKTLF